MDWKFLLRLLALENVRIFRSAAWYALTHEEIEDTFEHEKVDVDEYIKGL